MAVEENEGVSAMTIRREQVLAMKPCDDFKEWYEGNNETDALKLLLQVNEKRPDWACWGFTREMNHRQLVRIAIYAAGLVIDLYDGPSDAPRKAIEAAGRWLDGSVSQTDAYDAAYAAYDAAYTAYDAANIASHAASHAAYAANAAANAAAYAAADAADAAYVASHAAAYATYAANAAQKETQEKIIRQAVRILEEKE